VVALKYGGGNINFIPRSAQDRYALAVLAIGDNPQLKVRQFVQLHEKSETVPQQNKEKDIKEDEQRWHDTVLGHTEDEPVALKEILKLHQEVAADIELKIRDEDNNFKKGYYNFLRTYRKIVTKCRGHSPVASLANVFVHFGKQQSSNLIPVLHNGRAFFNIQAGGGICPPQSPFVPPPRKHILPPQEKSLFPKIIQTIQRRLTNR
jgi:hypothetical protein